jgi:nucleoside-diphosphate-sugar epimerase
VFNISTGIGTSTRNVVEIVREILDWKGEVNWGMHPRPFEPKYLVLDNSKARRMIGFSSKITLDEGIRRIAYD